MPEGILWLFTRHISDAVASGDKKQAVLGHFLGVKLCAISGCEIRVAIDSDFEVVFTGCMGVVFTAQFTPNLTNAKHRENHKLN